MIELSKLVVYFHFSQCKTSLCLCWRNTHDVSSLFCVREICYSTSAQKITKEILVKICWQSKTPTRKFRTFLNFGRKINRWNFKLFFLDPIRDPVRDPVRDSVRDPVRDPIRSDPGFVDAAKYLFRYLLYWDDATIITNAIRLLTSCVLL